MYFCPKSEWTCGDRVRKQCEITHGNFATTFFFAKFDDRIRTLAVVGDAVFQKFEFYKHFFPLPEGGNASLLPPPSFQRLSDYYAGADVREHLQLAYTRGMWEPKLEDWRATHSDVTYTGDCYSLDLSEKVGNGQPFVFSLALKVTLYFTWENGRFLSFFLFVLRSLTLCPPPRPAPTTSCTESGRRTWRRERCCRRSTRCRWGRYEYGCQVGIFNTIFGKNGTFSEFLFLVKMPQNAK